MYLHGWQCSEIKLYVPHRRLTDIPIGRDATLEEYDPDDTHYFTDGYANYRLLEDLPKSDLDDILEVFNDHFGADCFCVSKTPIGYGYYKCVND